MNRKEFIKQFALLGIGAPLMASLLGACDGKEDFPTVEGDFSGKVLIVGAGAAGITAGYLLARQGIDFQIVEAAAGFGGRVKRLDGFADFPIDLGGEWIHTDPSILSELISDSSVQAKVDLVNYRPQTVSVWKNNQLKKRNFVSNFYREYKFKRTTWYGFFEKFMIPRIEDKILYNRPIASIDYSADKVRATDVHGNAYEADRMLVTVPISILQQNLISFEPALPQRKMDALDSIDFPPILKVFIEFSERFYPDMTVIDGILIQEKLYYDAAFGKDAEKHILGLFVIGDYAVEYNEMASEEAVVQSVIEELDDMFDGQASANYVKSVVQNWTKEPYIRGSYSHFQADYTSTIETLVEPLGGNKLFFAGEAMVLNGDTSTVHGAAESAYQAIQKIMQS
ncbi:MAG: NAD(P)/FAD-dependent oxidoreductase [Bacteroidota bacterium]